ncbi:MAG: hypothetical protein OEW81_11295 [Gammaproteobacteria bacterium]|nr:hypothetical protein [Gammaproteobacteria bacterium]
MNRYLAIGMLLVPAAACADGIVVDRIYDPYVEALETEIELRSILQYDDELGDAQKYSFGVGHALSDRWALEFYAIGTRFDNEHLSINAYELEAKWQLTEQGEFAFDWGVVFEIERGIDTQIWEVTARLLASRDFGRWTGIANLGLVYEWGSGVEDEIETELRAQARYRLSESLQPAFEFHLGQDTLALGPVLTGLYRLSPGRKLRWEAGVFLGMDDESPDRTLKLNVEYEF